jgi:hypothetical protein
MVENPLVFYDFVMKCRDNSYKMWTKNAEKELQALSFMQQEGRIHQSIRNIVLSAVEGDDMDMLIMNPVKSEGQGHNGNETYTGNED